MVETRYQRCPTCQRQIARKRYACHHRQHQLDRLMGTAVVSDWKYLTQTIVVDAHAPEQSMYFLDASRFIHFLKG